MAALRFLQEVVGSIAPPVSDPGLPLNVPDPGQPAPSGSSSAETKHISTGDCSGPWHPWAQRRAWDICSLASAEIMLRIMLQRLAGQSFGQPCPCTCAGMMVFSMILWLSIGHKISHRCFNDVGVLIRCQYMRPSSQPSSVLSVLGSSKYIGEGMSASLTGLVLGGILLALRGILLSEETTQQLLTFNHSKLLCVSQGQRLTQRN